MPEPFKNLFNAQLIRQIGEHLQRVDPTFDAPAFARKAEDGLDQLELKARSQQIRDALVEYLPADFSQAQQLLLDALHPEEDVDLRDLTMDARGIRGWAIMPIADFIAHRGQDEFELSMQALKEMTKRFSAEFAIRSFIIADPIRALRLMTQWATEQNDHVRRLASEGARPRLPWGQQIKALIADPAPLIPLLQRLRDDPSDYVRRSVANNLNDIAKDHPELVADLAQQWLENAPVNRQRLIRHACRTLIKKGHTKTLFALGVAPAEIAPAVLTLSEQKIHVGQALKLNLVLRSLSRKPQNLVVDYMVYHRRANGDLAGKMFKWKTLILLPEQTLMLERNHSFKVVTTRKYYAGDQAVAVRINGALTDPITFELCEDRKVVNCGSTC